ncbi:hypothetical protein K1719_000926 [Acacia pycnantha]|nr:hypothetical protein K1719_000926 [Acacia pycnantha]
MSLVLSKKIPAKIASSSEEEDLFHRSLKKIKNSAVPSPDEEWPLLRKEGGKPWMAGPSFAEKLQGINRNVEEANVMANVNDLSDDPLTDSDHIESDKDVHEPLCVIKEDPNRNFPTFTFSDRMKKRLYKAWEKAVIVKLLGRDIGYMLLHSILQPLWAKRGVINLINIGNGFFVVKFSNKEDYLNALTGGPWMIFDHYLTVRPWEPMFHPMRATINKVAVWKIEAVLRGGKEKTSPADQRKPGGSRFEVLEGEGDDVGGINASSASAGKSGGHTDVRSSVSAPERGEKRGKGNKKQGKGNKSYAGEGKAMGEGKALGEGKSEKKSEKRTREVRQKGSKEGKILSINYGDSTENNTRGDDMMEVQAGNLMLMGPTPAVVVEGASSKEGSINLFPIEPGEGGPASRLEGKFWEGTKALDPDDLWEEEAQLPNQAYHESVCEMDAEVREEARDGGSVVPETQFSSV